MGPWCSEGSIALLEKGLFNKAALKWHWHRFGHYLLKGVYHHQLCFHRDISQDANIQFNISFSEIELLGNSF